MVSFTQSQLEFLWNYIPKNKRFTTEEEINKISQELNFSECESLNILRNDVVELYDALMDEEVRITDLGIERTEKYWQYLVAMQSVTAVIDHTMYGAF